MMDERRKHIRIDSHNLVYLCIKENEEIIQQGMGRTLNVSEAGIRLEAGFSIGTKQTLWMTIGFMDDTVDIQGELVYYIEGKKNRDYGIRFLEMNESARHILKRYIENFRKIEGDKKEPQVFGKGKNAMTTAVTQTDFPDLQLIMRGKVRDMYDLGETILMVATDRISAFDVILPNPVPGKGIILTQISLFWFNQMSSILPNHVITADVDEYPRQCRPYKEILEGRSMLVRKTRPLPIECVVRGYLSGSGWKSYRESGSICGIQLPAGLMESSRLPEPVFTPSTKADQGEHDINIDFETAAQKVGRETAQKVRDYSLSMYRKGSEIAEKKGIIIADTKFEFGLLGNDIILIDEVLTPDSSRFWPRSSYKPGQAQKSYDKQYLRDYLLSISWDQTPPGPVLPEEVIQNTRKKYLEALVELTGDSHGL